MVTKKMGIASITGRSAGHRPVTTVRQTGHMDWKDVPTRTLDVNGTSFAYRALGPDTQLTDSAKTSGELPHMKTAET